jgi:uncharacterized membrane protein
MEGITLGVEQIFEAIGIGFDVFGVLVILVGVVAATVRYLRHMTRADHNAYKRYKVDIGLALLLGLEILVAADIIKTVALEPNFNSLGVLAALVVIRTFLSWTLVLEIEGRFPWQAKKETEA